MKRIISLLLLVSILLTFSSCRGGEKQYTTRSRTISESHFNTYSAIFTYADEDDTNIERWAAMAEKTLSYYHKLFDIYYEYAGVNNIMTINKNAGVAPVEVDEEMIDFLIYCKELYTLTQGKTNVMLGSVLKIWHDKREEADSGIGYLEPENLPTEAELKEANKHTSIDLLVINEEESTVYISDPKASLDVGAIAKGYTVDIVYNQLREDGADSVILNIGGNVRTIGLKPDGSKWESGVTNPDRESRETVICRMNLGETSVVTSGDYERYFVSGSKKYHHIIDPATLVPAAYFSSVTIITESSALADSLSTALFCMTYEEGLALINSIDADIEVIWIDTEYNIKHTDGIEFRV